MESSGVFGRVIASSPHLQNNVFALRICAPRPSPVPPAPLHHPPLSRVFDDRFKRVSFDSRAIRLVQSVKQAMSMSADSATSNSLSA